MDKYGQMSKWNRSMTFLSIGILVGFSFIPWLIGDENEVLFIAAIVVFAVVLLKTLIAYWYIPLEVSVSNTFLRINFPLRRRMFPIMELKSARVYHVSKDFVCKVGVKFYFGWRGKYHDKSLGLLYVYASNFKHLVLVEMQDGRKYVISCSDADIMAKSINKRIGLSGM